MPPLQVTLIPALSDNYIYLVRDDQTGTTAVVDPADAAPVTAALEARGWTLDLILNTHHHGDHTAGNAALKQRYGAMVWGPAAERARIGELDRPLAAGDRVTVGGDTALVFETPGHTAGHISLFFEQSHLLFSGDTLFALGCGRMFEGDAEQFWASLSRLRDLPDDTLVYCGHEYTQSNARFARSLDPANADLAARAERIDTQRAAGEPTIPFELGLDKRTNPFLRADDPGLQAKLGLGGADPAQVFAEIRRRKDAA